MTKLLRYILPAVLLMVHMRPAAGGTLYCLTPAGGEEITDVECQSAVQDPRCQTPCDCPPCTGYPFPVRPAKLFRWFQAGVDCVYRITAVNLLSGDSRSTVLQPFNYAVRDGVCESYQGVNAFLPILNTPSGPMPMIGQYRWILDLREGDFWTELDGDAFVYLHNANPFGTAAIAFRWQTAPGLDFCGQQAGPVDFWIHLPIEYPDNRPGRSAYEWGYLLIQASEDLLPPDPRMDTDYAVESIPVPGEAGCENLKLWIRNRVPDADSRIAYHLFFTLEDPWSDLSWNFEVEFDLENTQMPFNKEIWPWEFVDAGYLDEGIHTAPMRQILDEYLWCDPYPRCVLCPWSEQGHWCGSCWDGPEGDFCTPGPGQPPFDPSDRSTWKGINALEWFRTNRLFNPQVPWSIDDNLRALDRLMSRWPGRFMGEFHSGMNLTAMYNTNDLVRLCDPNVGLDVWDHWRYTDAQPMEYFLTGMGCSNASTHFGLSMARLMNFPARSVCMAHYHDDLEIWLPYGPPVQMRYKLNEGEWVRFVGEQLAPPDYAVSPPDPAGGPFQSSLPGMLKTTNYISWDPEDSIPFNWFLSDSQTSYKPCKATLIDRQWPAKLTHLDLPDDQTRLIIVWPSKVNFSCGSGMETIRNLECSPELRRWTLIQHLIPLGASRFGFIMSRSGEYRFIAMDGNLEKSLDQTLVFGESQTIEEPDYYHVAFRPVIREPYVYLEITRYEVNWDRPGPLPTPRPTATPIGTPTPTATPSPTPTVPPLGVTLDLPRLHFTAGDAFYLNARLSNPGESIPSLYLFVILQIGESVYFGPTWMAFDPETGSGLNGWYLNLETGERIVEAIPGFTWPQVTQPLSGLVFLAALVDMKLTHVMGSIDRVEWSYE